MQTKRLKHTFKPWGPLHALRSLPYIRYGISLFIFVICCSYAVFRCAYSVFVIRYSYASRAVTSNEENAITSSVCNRKNHSKRLKSLR